MESNGADGFGLDAFAAGLLGCHRPLYVCDANAVAYRFVQSFVNLGWHGTLPEVLLLPCGDYSDCCAGSGWSCRPALARRHDMWLGMRVGEATHPGPGGLAAKRRAQLGIPKTFLKKEVSKLCREVFRELLVEFGVTLQLAPASQAGRGASSWKGYAEWNEWDEAPSFGGAPHCQNGPTVWHGSGRGWPVEDGFDDCSGWRSSRVSSSWDADECVGAHPATDSWDAAAADGARAGRVVSYYAGPAETAAAAPRQDDQDGWCERRLLAASGRT